VKGVFSSNGRLTGRKKRVFGVFSKVSKNAAAGGAGGSQFIVSFIKISQTRLPGMKMRQG
jgi:hypothetical protein